MKTKIVAFSEQRIALRATLPEGNDFVAIAAGACHSLALKSDGTIVCWGLNNYGQATPPTGNDFVAISAGWHHSLALKSDGSIVGWGYNGFGGGQAEPPAGNDFVAIAAGGYHSLGLKSDGTVVGWGWDAYDQASSPVGSDFVAIAAGQNHSVARKSDGSVVAWGLNDASQAAAPLTAVVEWYSYDVFGEPTIKGPSGLPRTASVVGNRFMFTGREYEKRNSLQPSLYYYRARHYSPKLGRFLQTDPIGYASGLNLYSYVGNNPLNWIDPYGLDEFRPWWMGPLGVIADAAGWTYDSLGGQRGEVWYGGGARALGGLGTMIASGALAVETSGVSGIAGGGIGFSWGWNQWKSGLDMMAASFYDDNWESYLNRNGENALRGVGDVAAGLLTQSSLTTVQGVTEILLSVPHGFVHYPKMPTPSASEKDSNGSSQDFPYVAADPDGVSL